MNMGAADINEMKIVSESPVILSVPINGEADCIMYIYTPPALRGQGKMRAMFEAHLKWADEAGKRLFLLLSPDDDTDEDRLRAFYESQGFEFGDDRDYDKHAIRMPIEG